MQFSWTFGFVMFLRKVFGLLGISGKGSYGAVYKARDKVTSELVAIKVISLSEGVSFCVLNFLSCAFCLAAIRGCVIDIDLYICFRRRDTRKFGVRSRCCSNVVIRM